MRAPPSLRNGTPPPRPAVTKEACDEHDVQYHTIGMFFLVNPPSAPGTTPLSAGLQRFVLPRFGRVRLSRTHVEQLLISLTITEIPLFLPMPTRALSGRSLNMPTTQAVLAAWVVGYQSGIVFATRIPWITALSCSMTSWTSCLTTWSLHPCTSHRRCRSYCLWAYWYPQDNCS